MQKTDLTHKIQFEFEQVFRAGRTENRIDFVRSHSNSIFGLLGQESRPLIYHLGCPRSKIIEN